MGAPDACLAQAVMHAEKRQPIGMGRLSLHVARSLSGGTAPAVWQAHPAMHAKIAIPGGGASLVTTAVRRSAGLRVQYAVAALHANRVAATVVSSTDGTGLASVSAKSKEIGGIPSLEIFPTKRMKLFSVMQLHISLLTLFYSVTAVLKLRSQQVGVAYCFW